MLCIPSAAILSIPSIGSLVPSMAFHFVNDSWPSYFVFTSNSPTSFTSFPLKSVYFAFPCVLRKLSGYIKYVMYMGIIDMGLPVSRTALTLTLLSSIFNLMHFLSVAMFCML